MSLFPSATELLAGIGATEDLVGRSHQCNHPPAISDLPAVTTSKLQEDGPSDAGAIDSVVDDHAHGESTFFRVDTDALRSLDPDLLVSQSLCEVCAVPASMTTDSLRALDSEPDLVSLRPSTMADILDAIGRLGAAVGRESAAEGVVAELRERIDRVQGSRPDARPQRVVCLEWTDELRCHGLWVPEFVTRLGAEPGFGRPGEHGRVIEWEALWDYDPEVLIVSPCGRSLSEIRADMDHLVDRPGWEELTAVASDRVYLLDGELSSRHGPRVVRAFELVASVLHPEAYDHVRLDPDEVTRFV